MIIIGSDHGGLTLKKTLTDYLQQRGITVADAGTDSDASVDYPDFGQKVAEAVSSGAAESGILVCGTGIGMSIAANKIPGIRAGLCHDSYSAHQGVEHDDINVLCLGGRIIGCELAYEVVRAFVAAKFSNAERHARRRAKVIALEQEFQEKRP